MNNIRQELLNLLVCPITKQQLEYLPEKQILISKKAGLAYKVKNGIPILVAEEAIPLSDLELQNTKEISS